MNICGMTFTISSLISYAFAALGRRDQTGAAGAVAGATAGAVTGGTAPAVPGKRLSTRGAPTGGKASGMLGTRCHP